MPILSNLTIIGSLVLGSGGFLAGVLAIYMAKTNKGKTESETSKTKAEAKEIDERAAALGDERYRKQEQFWKGQVQDVKNELEGEIGELRDEVSWLKFLIENHVPWDWETQRLLTMQGLDHRKPPTLNYIRRQQNHDEEIKDKE